MPQHNKYNFIKDLLVDKSLDHNQREKLFTLIANELNIEGDLSERVKKIEDVLNINTTGNFKIEQPYQEELKQELEQEKKDNLPKYIYPSNLYKFLFAYNQDPILKYTCHLIDKNALDSINELCGTGTYDYKLHYNKILDSFQKLENRYGHANKNTRELIRVYLTGKGYYGEKTTWGADEIEFNWSNEEINDWVIKNNSCPANPDAGFWGDYGNPSSLDIGKVIISKIIPENEKYERGFIIQTFSDLVFYFKYLFHIRFNNPLQNILLFQNFQRGWNDKVEFVIKESLFPKNVEFFTDVNKVIQIYNKIIRLITEVSKNQDKPIVELKLKESENNIELSIHHKNSKYQKTIQNIIDRPGDTYTELIKKLINGLCNFYIRADFGGGNYAKVNIWNEDFVTNGTRKRRVIKRYKNFEGVEHILEFKKK